MRIALILILLLNNIACKEFFLTEKARRSYYQKKYADNNLKDGDIQISVINNFDQKDILKVFENDSLLFILTGEHYDSMKLLATRFTYNTKKENLIYTVKMNDSLIGNFITKRISMEPLFIVVGKENDNVTIGKERR
jgi:hypothetical protein